MGTRSLALVTLNLMARMSNLRLRTVPGRANQKLTSRARSRLNTQPHPQPRKGRQRHNNSSAGIARASHHPDPRRRGPGSERGALTAISDGAAFVDGRGRGYADKEGAMQCSDCAGMPLAPAPPHRASSSFVVSVLPSSAGLPPPAIPASAPTPSGVPCLSCGGPQRGRV